MVYDHEHKSISLWELIKKNEGQKAREHEQTRIHVSAWFEAVAHLTIEIKIEERMDPNSNSPNSSEQYFLAELPLSLNIFGAQLDTTFYFPNQISSHDKCHISQY